MDKANFPCTCTRYIFVGTGVIQESSYLLEHKQHKYFLLCASVTTVYLFFFVIGRVLTRLTRQESSVTPFVNGNCICVENHRASI